MQNHLHHFTSALGPLAKDIVVFTVWEHLLGRWLGPSSVPPNTTTKIVFPEQPGGLQAGRKGRWTTTRQQGWGHAHTTRLYTLKPKETAWGEMRWMRNELNWSQSDFLLWWITWKKCSEICASAQHLSQQILLQQWPWEADFPGALARVAVSSSACYRAQDRRAHTPTRALDYPETHQLFAATLKCIRQNMAGLQFLGLLTWLFQVSAYFHFKVPGIAEAGCFGWTITQHKCKSKRAC